jgi:Bacterial membrane protein YfhO
VSGESNRRLAVAAITAIALALSFNHLFFGLVSAGRDLYRLFIPETAYLGERLRAGELPLWIARERLGQPYLALLYTQVLYPPRMLFAVLFGGVWGTNLFLLFHAGLAATGAYLAARKLGAARLPALVAASFGFTPFYTRLQEMAHAASSLAWSGWILFAALHLARRPSPRGVGLLALALGASAACGAPELLVWQGPLALLAALSTRRPLRALPWLAAACALAVLLCAVTFLPGLELSRAWARPGEVPADRLLWSTSWVQLLAPAMLLVDSPREKLADQWFVTSLFIGALPCLFALAGARRRHWPLWALAAGCTALSLGKHFPPAALLMDVPPLSLFRYPVKYQFGALFCLAVLAALGLSRLIALAKKVPASRKRGLIALGAALFGPPLVARLLSLGPWRTGVSIGFFWLGAWACAAAIAFFNPKGPRRARSVRFFLLLLVALELLVSRVLVPNSGLVAASLVTAPSRLAEAIRSDSPGRLSILQEDGDIPDSAPLSGSDSPIAKSRENLLGLRYLEEGFSIPEGYGFRDPWRLADATAGNPRGAYDLFGVTHYLRGDGPPFADLEPMEATGGWMKLYRSRSALPRAFVVHEAQVATDAEALAFVRGGAAALKAKVLLERGEALPGADCASTATLTTEKNERLALSVDACAEGYLVVTDSHDPNWAATLDDKPVDIARADHLLRAVRVPAGKHTVTMEYRPAAFRAGAWVSALALLLTLAALARGPRLKSA